MTTAKSEPQLDLQARTARAEPPRPEPEYMEPFERAPEVAHRVPPKASQDALVLPDVINLREVIRRILRGWWIVLLSVAAALTWGYRHLSNATPVYTATLIISSVSDSTGSPVGSGDTSGGLSSLLGGAIVQPEAVSDFTRFRYLMGSRDLAERLAKRYDLVKVVFAGEWDAENQRWIRPQSAVADWLYEQFGVQWYAEPSVDRLAESLKSRFEITNLESTPMLQIDHIHPDPEFAKRLLELVYRETDQLMRERDRAATEEAVAYLNDALSRATIAEHRLALQQLLLRNLAKLMLLDTDQPFAARMLEPPYVSVLPTSPNPRLVLFYSVIGGGIAGLALIFVVDALRGR